MLFLFVVRHLICMSFDMSFHFFLAFECFIANCTLVAFRSIVLHSMQFQHVIVAKVTETDIAVIRLLSGVRSGMDFELFRACESFSTSLNRTFVGFFASMRSHMYHQLTGLNEGFVAHRALMRTLSSMDSHVPMQFATMFECSPANFAFIWPFLGMNTTMYLKILLNAKHLMTEFTFKGSLARMSAIMSNQSCRHSECLLANIALIWIRTSRGTSLSGCCRLTTIPTTRIHLSCR